MYKALCVAGILMATIAFTSGSKAANATGTSLPSPVIVAKAKLISQTAPISTTTIFTPVKDGLFRISVYLAMTATTQNDANAWSMNLFYTDEAGGEQGVVAYLPDSQVPPFDYALSGGLGQASPFVFRAIAGVPVSYSVTGPAGGTYELFFTVERLM